jgi:trimeric autotransporter adhesin
LAATRLIAGGGAGGSGNNNRVTDDFGAIAGGQGNQAGDGAGSSTDRTHATVGGGSFNLASGTYATIGGGSNNVASIGFATIAGGVSNTASGNQATIGGGEGNSASQAWSTIGGGIDNIASGLRSTVGGGNLNTASGNESTVAGGASNRASGTRAAVSGGRSNVANGAFSMIPGGEGNLAVGQWSFAGGRGAKVGSVDPFIPFDGTFLWADSTTDAGFFANSDNEFAVRAAGGFRFRTNAALTTGCNLPAGSGTFACTSDKNVKANFSLVDPQEVLSKVASLPITTWNYKTERESVRHMGPTAQDFHAAFRLGTDDKTIGHIDESGVALAAIQGLYSLLIENERKLLARLAEKDAEIGALKNEKDAEIKALRAIVGGLVEQNAIQRVRLDEIERSLDRNTLVPAATTAAKKR